MKIIPLILIIVGSVLVLGGIVLAIFLPTLMFDTPEDIRDMKVGDRIEVYGELEYVPPKNEYYFAGFDEANQSWDYQKYRYEFTTGDVFFSDVEDNPSELGVEEGSSNVIKLVYRRGTSQGPEGAYLDGSPSKAVSGTVGYRFIGIAIAVVGVALIVTAIIFIMSDVKEEQRLEKERRNRRLALDKEMAQIEMEIQSSLRSTPRHQMGRGPPPGQMQPGQQPRPQGVMPPQGQRPAQAQPARQQPAQGQRPAQAQPARRQPTQGQKPANEQPPKRPIPPK